MFAVQNSENVVHTDCPLVGGLTHYNKLSLSIQTALTTLGTQGKQNICITWCSKANAGGSISTPEGITEASPCLEIPKSKVQEGLRKRRGMIGLDKTFL